MKAHTNASSSSPLPPPLVLSPPPIARAWHYPPAYDLGFGLSCSVSRSLPLGEQPIFQQHPPHICCWELTTCCISIQEHNPLPFPQMRSPAPSRRSGGRRTVRGLCLATYGTPLRRSLRLAGARRDTTSPAPSRVPNIISPASPRSCTMTTPHDNDLPIPKRLRSDSSGEVQPMDANSSNSVRGDTQRDGRQEVQPMEANSSNSDRGDTQLDGRQTNTPWIVIIEGKKKLFCPVATCP